MHVHRSAESEAQSTATAACNQCSRRLASDRCFEDAGRDSAPVRDFHRSIQPTGDVPHRTLDGRRYPRSSEPPDDANGIGAIGTPRSAASIFNQSRRFFGHPRSLHPSSGGCGLALRSRRQSSSATGHTECSNLSELQRNGGRNVFPCILKLLLFDIQAQNFRVGQLKCFRL
jgi:hypothetical protein